jgi:hypothetical protein
LCAVSCRADTAYYFVFPASILPIDKECTAEFKSEHFSKAAIVCENAAKSHEGAVSNLHDDVNADRQVILGAKWRMIAAAANLSDNKDDLACRQVRSVVASLTNLPALVSPHLVAAAIYTLNQAKAFISDACELH